MSLLQLLDRNKICSFPLRNFLANMSRSRDSSGPTNLLNKFSKQFPSFMEWTFLHSDIFIKIQAFIIDEKTTFTVWLNINLISFKAKTIIFLDFSMITSEMLFDPMLEAIMKTFVVINDKWFSVYSFSFSNPKPLLVLLQSSIKKFFKEVLLRLISLM